MKAILMLEDGKGFLGETLSGSQEGIGEVIFNTAVVGYQEMMTDPANAGKILVLTYPLIGNYGIAPKFNESKRVWLLALVIKENSRVFSNWQAKSSFTTFAKAERLCVLAGVDTRTLAVHIRQKGQMLGIISSQTFEPKELLCKINAFRKNQATGYIAKISVAKPTRIGKKKKGTHRVAVLDLGITNSILRQLEALGFCVTLFPYDTPWQEIMRLRPHGLIICGGPEEDPALPVVVSNIKALIGKIPMMGISTGHQVICRALGADVIKMKLGHHGVNYPIHNPKSFKGEITVQNHSYTVDADSLSTIRLVRVTAFNLNDRTVEGIESVRLRLMGVQYLPQSPRFEKVHSAFEKFAKTLMRATKRS